MEEQSLISEGWTFCFDNAVKRAGTCRHTRKSISLSRYFTSYANADEVEQVILHEIAHAILPVEVGHREPWKIMANALGYKGQRTVRNPYLEARIREAVVPGESFSSRMPEPLQPLPVIGIGTIFTYCGKAYTVYSKGSSRWHAQAPGEVRTMIVPFEIAHLFLAPLSANQLPAISERLPVES